MSRKNKTINHTSKQNLSKAYRLPGWWDKFVEKFGAVYYITVTTHSNKLLLISSVYDLYKHKTWLVKCIRF